MTSSDFATWLDHMGLSQRQAAVMLDISRNSVAKYLEIGAPALVGYACAALAAGLPQWSGAANG